MANKVEKPKPIGSAVMALPQPPLRNAQEYLKAYTGYAYTAISAIAQEVASIELRLFKVKFTQKGPEPAPLYEHGALSLLQYVNPFATFYDLVEATQIYLELVGESFWVILKEGKNPKEIWMLRPDWVSITPDNKDIIKNYVYHPGGNNSEKVIIPKENVIHFKNFHPLNPYRGKGTLQAAALPFDILNFAQEYNRNFFFNSAIPSLVFSTEKKLSATAIKRFVNQWQSSYGGRAKSNKIAFLGSGLKMDKMNSSAQELDFANQQKMMRDDILAVFKVPKTILGMTDDVNRANAEATTMAFMERVVTPRMRKFVGQLNEFLLPMYSDGASLFFDFIDPSPEDTEMKLKRYENGRKYGWLTPNEIRTEENLEPIEGGDDLTPISNSPNPQPDDTDTEETGNEEEDDLKGFIQRLFGKKKIEEVKKKVERPAKKEKYMMGLPVKRLEVIKREKLEKKLSGALAGFVGKWLEAEKYENEKKKKEQPKVKESLFTEEAKDAYWKAFIKLVTEREEELKETATKLFKEQESIVLEKLNSDVKYWRKSVRKGKEASVLQSLKEMVMMWQAVFIQIVREIVIEQGDFTLNFLGAGGSLDLTSSFAIQFLREHGTELITEINETTRENLKKTLAEGFEAEEGIRELSVRIEDVFKIATRTRATLIARTEALRASNFGTLEAYRQSEVVEAKEWLAERDDRTCSYCDSMDGKILGLNESYFEKGDSLTIGGNTLNFDLMSVDYPPLHPNCRCTLIPVLLGERSYPESEQKKN